MFKNGMNDNNLRNLQLVLLFHLTAHLCMLQARINTSFHDLEITALQPALGKPLFDTATLIHSAFSHLG